MRGEIITAGSVSQAARSDLHDYCRRAARASSCNTPHHLAFPHNLKRVWRFVSNERLNRDASKGVVARRALRQLHHRLQLKPGDPLKIVIDWTSVWPYQMLQALVP